MLTPYISQTFYDDNRRNNAYISLSTVVRNGLRHFKREVAEQTPTETGATKVARDAYRTFIKALNALLILHSNTDIETCATEINGYIAYQQNVLAVRKGRAAKKRKRRTN